MTITEQFKAKRCVFSIECFPPKQTTQMDKLKDTLRQMQAMDPGFISVTFGAGGSAGGVSTAEVADYIQNELHVSTLAHLICMGNDETRAAEILDQLESVGVRDVLAHFYRFLNLARRAGITLPVSAGVMPIVKRSQIERTVSLSSASLPSEFTRMISRYQDDPASLYDAGIDYAVRQLRDLIEGGADGIHLYAMNDAAVAAKVYDGIRDLL